MDFTEFDLQRIPYSSHALYLRRNFARFLALDTNVWGIILQISGIHSKR